MKLVFYFWQPEPTDNSFPQLTTEKPDDVEVDEKTGEWWYNTKDKDDSGFGKKFKIGMGGLRGSSYRQLVPGARFNKGCIAVLDITNFEHVQALEALAFHFGTQHHRPIDERKP